MQPKIFWIDNLRGIACLMVVMIHTTTWYITNAQSVSPLNWDLANVLNSASRVSVPLFFMISGYLFFGERSAKPRHFMRIALCILFYSSVALAYILLFTSINAELSLKNLLQKPVFYHLWFFFAIAVIYMVSPLIQGKNISGKMLLALMVVIGVIANPNTVSQKIGGFEWLPVNLYISGDTFYYILYGMLGRAIGMMDTQKRALSWLCAGLFITAVFIISRGTLHELRWSKIRSAHVPCRYWALFLAIHWAFMVFMRLSFTHYVPTELNSKTGHRWICCGFSAPRWQEVYCCLFCCSVLIRVGW